MVIDEVKPPLAALDVLKFKTVFVLLPHRIFMTDLKSGKKAESVTQKVSCVVNNPPE